MPSITGTSQLNGLSGPFFDAATEEELDLVEADVTTLQTDVTGLRTDLTATQTNVTALQTFQTNAQQSLNRIETRRYDIREWGDPFTDEPGAIFATAATEISTAGGGVLTGPSGDYTFLTGFTLPASVALDFPGRESAHFNFSGMTTAVNDSAIYSEGSLTALPALGANIGLHATEITFASAPDVAPGDLINIYDSADFSFSTARSYYRAGEYVRVLSVAGSVVTITSPTIAAYASGSTVSAYRLNPVSPSMRGFSATFKNGSRGIAVELGADFSINDLLLTGSDESHIAISRCYNVAFSRNYIWDFSPAAGLNYGIVTGSSQRVSYTDNFIETTRHGIAHGAGSGIGAIPCREITAQGGTISGGAIGFDAHGNSEFMTVNGVNLPSGIGLNGDHVAILNCQIRVNSIYGSAVQMFTELLGANIRIENNDIELTHAQASDTKSVIRIEARAPLTRSGGTIRIRGNTINMNGYSLSDTGRYGGISVYNRASTAINSVDISDNTILGGSTTADDTEGYAARVATDFTVAGWDRIRMNNNIGERLGFLIEGNGSTVEVIGNQSINAPKYGVFVNVYFTTVPGPELRLLRVFDNLVEGAWRAGIYLRTRDDITYTEVRRNRSINNNRGVPADTGLDRGSLYIVDGLHWILDDNVIGDNQAVPTQPFPYEFWSTGTVIESNTQFVGGEIPQSFASNKIATRRVDLTAPGAPTILAAKGSRWYRTDGGASTTLYINETGTTTWRAV